MFDWIALAAGVVLTFTAHQFYQYCRGQNLKMLEGMARLYKKFIGDVTSAFSGPKT